MGPKNVFKSTNYENIKQLQVEVLEVGYLIYWLIGWVGGWGPSIYLFTYIYVRV